jgi:hypothetical protein
MAYLEISLAVLIPRNQFPEISFQRFPAIGFIRLTVQAAPAAALD